MAKTVTSETPEQTFASEASSMGEFVQGLESLNNTYTSGLSEIEESITNATNNMANWAPDDVQIKLEAFVSELSGARATIESDISGGSFLSMKNTASQLVTDLNGCKEAKKAYENAKTDYENKVRTYNNTPSKIEEWHANSAIRKDNPAKKSAKTAMDNAKTAMDNAKTTLNTKVQTTNTHFLELSQFEFNGTAESSSGTGGQAPPPPPQDETPNEPGPGDFVPYEGTGDPNGVLSQTTYEVTDPETGETITMNLLVNTENGNIAYGNDELGYFITCISEDGSVLAGQAVGDATGLNGAASVITDGHENSNGSNKWFGISPHSTYGFGETISPVPLSRTMDNCVDATITVNDQKINIVLPIPENVLSPYSPYSLCDTEQSFGGASGGGGGGGFRGGGAGSGRH